ncbi:hypothetical protein CWB89_01530 [Pseudoalteromonas piscicida]|uniref:Uncharacterized protein n=1 Tax=Pseudoalteromonas piscicida TaxID=43662 RepID=A0AAQ2EXU8_PSEO7|nr:MULTISPECIES: hypothetical protein [Pseudoalteromonas]KJY90859.1 hypothetical protein TW75_06055 [Pseudoalteromonas piscicida]TMN42818.1 hypothetical protein CWB94_04560 [Pseudoalteromonas piscicida]TMN45535.1 hypothetical protein CWB95_01085 [Pseudoalteromonas piscicida]TMN50933.1 hypothetical protein CWB92_12450 [Pseudoalteromonas piscicida]TMN57718.1 hypothetical protein CWB93_08510 [Pseudoalteromonas piscicida]
MNPIYANILDIVPLKLNSTFAHLDPNAVVATDVNELQQVVLPAVLLQDFELAMGRKIEVVMGNTISLENNQLSLPSAQLSTAQKRELWQIIWSKQDAS